jgi:hypothetical protein
VPFAAEASSVEMTQESTFVKGPFALTLARKWTGATNVEVEAHLLKAKGQCVAILDVVDPESVLQNRCSDAQLANALRMRMPFY